MRIAFRRSLAAALVGALALSTIPLAPAQAAHRHWHHHRGNAAVLGAVAGMFGTIAALAAADRYRNDYYYDYDGGPYYDAPYGYYGGYGYAPGYGFGGFGGYRGRGGHGHHHHH